MADKPCLNAKTPGFNAISRLFPPFFASAVIHRATPCGTICALTAHHMPHTRKRDTQNIEQTTYENNISAEDIVGIFHKNKH